MIATIPETSSNWFSFPINYDNRVLTCILYWCEELQSMHAKVVAQLIRDAYNDPLVDAGGSYNRQYDVLEYYQAGNPLTRDSMFDEWYDRHKDNLPVSLKYANYNIYDMRRIVMQRSQNYHAIKNTRDTLNEQCVWTFTIKDGDDVITGVVNPGASYERWGEWTMWIRSDTRVRIGRNDLQFVTMEFV